MKFLKKLTEIFLLAFVFLLPWQTKLILYPAVDNFTEVSLYLSHGFLILSIFTFFIYQLKYKGRLEKAALIWYFLGGLEVFVLISFFFASNKFIAAYHYFILLLGFGIFYLLREGFKKAAYEDSCLNRGRAILAFLFSMFLQSILGIYQFLKQSSFSSKFLGLAEHNSQFLGSSVVETLSGRWLRAYGGMDHPNIFGGVLVFVLLLTAFLLASKKLINSQLEKWIILLLFLGYFISLTALFFTFSRAAWLAFVIGLGILTLLIFYEKNKLVFKRLLALIFFSAGLFLSAAWPYQEIVTTRITASSRLEKISINERHEQLDLASKIIQKNPLFGVGRGNYLEVTDNQGSKIVPNRQPVHNSFLLIFAESGLFSLLSVLGIFWFFIRNKKRQALTLSVVAALIILMMLDHWLVSLPFGVLFFFFILGVI